MLNPSELTVLRLSGKRLASATSKGYGSHNSPLSSTAAALEVL